jgi:hypothetical protein
MFRNRQGKVLLCFLALALVVAAVAITASRSRAQIQMPPGMGEGMEPPPPDGRMPRPGMPGMQPYPGFNMPPPMMGGMSSGVAIAATADYVYVVQGNTVYQFSAKTLKMVNKAELASTTSQPRYPQGSPGPPPPN